MNDATIVIVRDTSSHRPHKRFRIRGQTELASFEQDNADESGAYDEITQAELETIPRDDWCRRCWPEDDASSPDEGDE